MIEDPKGVDLEVWNKIKDSCDFARFLHEAEPCMPVYKPDERAVFLRSVEAIIQDHPESSFLDPLRSSIAKIKERNASLRKYKIQF